MNRLRGRLSSRADWADINPMEGLANLADVMIVLAVGIMLALIINWNVDIGAMARLREELQRGGDEDALAFDGEDMEEVSDQAERIDSEGMEKLGTVYFDEASGKYYIIAE